MLSLILRAVVAGLFFGIWPLLLRKSGLPSNFASLVFLLGSIVCVFPFTFTEANGAYAANWYMAIGASVTGAIGLLFFNGMLSDAKPGEVSSLFVVAMLTQISV